MALEAEHTEEWQLAQQRFTTWPELCLKVLSLCPCIIGKPVFTSGFSVHDALTTVIVCSSCFLHLPWPQQRTAYLTKFASGYTCSWSLTSGLTLSLTLVAHGLV